MYVVHFLLPGFYNDKQEAIFRYHYLEPSMSGQLSTNGVVLMV